MQIKYLKEIKLKFGKKIEAYDPRIGLLKGGPWDIRISDEELDFKMLNCGIIGTAFTIAKTKNFIDKLTFGFNANDKTYGTYGFPGLGIKSPLCFSLRPLKQWEGKIFDKEIGRLSSINDNNERKNTLIDLIENKIIKIIQNDPPPDLIFIALNQEIFKIFHRLGLISDNIIFANRNLPNSVYESEGDINFHNIVKILGMKHNIRTQLIKPDTLDFKAKEDEVTTAWNISVGLYYKANGIPWKFSKFDPDVCYVGISFYRDFSQTDMILNTSMAQVFISTGESYILRGDHFHWERSEHERTPRLDKEKAKSIIDKVLKCYYRQKGRYPSRIVIYKTSNFYNREIEGFYDNYGNIENIDMVTVYNYPKIRLYRQSQYPVMRGTMILSNNHKKAILYTFGYIPTLRTYPGMRTPIPIEVRQFTGNSEMNIICNEILTLTRLDWNNIKFCQRLPVTIAFSKKVGDILSERRARDIDIKEHYRYYM